MKNEGTADRTIRVVAGLALAALAWFALGVGNREVAGIIVGAIGTILIVTGAIGFCPAYKLCGLKTCQPK